MVTWGWPLIGPRLVAGVSLGDAHGEYVHSMRVRVLVLLTVSPFAGLAAWMVAPPEFQLVCLLMAAAGGAMGLSPAWFAVGLGRPAILAKYELLPRVVAMVAAAVVMVLTQWIVIYPILLLAAGFLGPAIYTWRVRQQVSAEYPKRKLFVSLRQNGTAVFAELLGGSYSTSTTALAGAVGSTQAAASYSAGEKIYRIGLFAVASVSNGLQNWIAAMPYRKRGMRLRLSLIIHSVIGMIGGGLMAGLGPWVTELMFTSQLRASPTTCAWLGAAYLAVSINTSLGRHFLALAGRLRPVLFSTAVGGLVGVPCILLGVIHFGSEGAAAALAISEVAVCVVQAIAIRVSLKAPSAEADQENKPPLTQAERA